MPFEANSNGNSSEHRGQHWLFRYLLVCRFAVLNIVATGLLAAVFIQGWLDGALVGHTGRLVLIICLAFLYGLVMCGVKVVRVSRELNEVRGGVPAPDSRAGKYLSAVAGKDSQSRLLNANLLRLRMTNDVSVVRYTASSLVFLGLVGTVIGFIIALSAVDQQASASVDTVAITVSTLINGMSIALYTTLVGAVLHLWLLVNFHMLATGAMHLFNAIVELGERDVGV